MPLFFFEPALKGAMMRTKLFLLSLILALTAGHALASDVTTHPGYADLSGLETILGDPATILDLDGVQITAMLGEQATEEISALVADLELVRVRTYAVLDGTAEAVRGSLATKAQALQDGGWSTIVQVHTPDDHVNVLLRLHEDRYAGVVLLVAEDSQAVVANVVGNVDPAKVGALLGQAQQIGAAFAQQAGGPSSGEN